MKKNYDSNDENSILNYAKELEGKSINMVITDNDSSEYTVTNKGALGQIVETDFFGIKNNSDKDADFNEVGVELKVVPVKKINKQKNANLHIKRDGLSVKERIALSIINFENIVDEDWETASIHKKLDKILMMFYMHENNISEYDKKFIVSDIWKPLKDDIPYLKKDWEFIKKKIKNGKAHELSEGDTLLLGACTKGATKSSVRTQPNSEIPAMQRAFSLKRSYVDHIFNTIYSNNTERKQPIPLNMYDEVIQKFQSVEGITLNNLSSQYNINVNREAKNYLALFTSKLFESLMNISTKEFNENNIANIEIKTIMMNSKNNVKESMSFEQIDYDELVNEDWEESKFRSKFENKKMLWVVFKANRTYNKQSELNLDEISFNTIFYWNMPNSDLDNDVKSLWEDTIKKVKVRDFKNFKKISETEVAHIRPKARNSADTITLSDGTVAPKKTYWLNAKYVEEQIELYNGNQNKRKNQYYKSMV